MTAPHEGREVELILSGVKPFAVIEYEKDPDAYTIVVGAPDLFESRVVVSAEGEEVQFIRRDSVEGCAAMELYRALVRNSETYVNYMGIESYQTAMGKIFGYTDTEIAQFISGETQCNCSKCVGMSASKGTTKLSENATQQSVKGGDILAYTRKALLYRNKQYVLRQQPSVISALWSENDWIKYIDQNGHWLNDR